MSLVDDYRLTGNPEDGRLTLACKRYRPKKTSNSKHEDQLALILIHGVGTHKETWEPVIEHLFDLQTQASDNQFVIKEAWVMDLPNHGYSAALNDEALLKRPEGICTQYPCYLRHGLTIAYSSGRGVQALLRSGLIAGTKVVGVGHSAGACVSILSTVGYSTRELPELPYSSMILIEPPMMTEPILAAALKGGSYMQQLVGSARTRKDIWSSRDAARQWLSKRPPFNAWHPRSIQLFINAGLRDLPTASYPDLKEGITLSCTREQEAVGYIYQQDGVDSLERLKELCPVIPVHCILGSRIDLMPDVIHQGVTDATQGRRMASIVKVADAGHAAVQENPTGTALAIWGALSFGQQMRVGNQHDPQKSRL